MVRVTEANPGSPICPHRLRPSDVEQGVSAQEILPPRGPQTLQRCFSLPHWAEGTTGI